MSGAEDLTIDRATHEDLLHIREHGNCNMFDRSAIRMAADDFGMEDLKNWLTSREGRRLLPHWVAGRLEVVG
jgi:hypothetical protein